MKIYWKGLIWNCTVRYRHLFKYYKQGLNKSRWWTFYYPHKKFTSERQQKKFYMMMFNETLKTIKKNNLI